MADDPGPMIIWPEVQGVKGHAQVAVVWVDPGAGFKGEPGAQFRGKIGIKIGKRGLAVLWIQPPVGEQLPIEKIRHATKALGLQAISQSPTHDILAVNRIN